jgi:hypothetical protein
VFDVLFSCNHICLGFPDSLADTDMHLPMYPSDPYASAFASLRLSTLIYSLSMATTGARPLDVALVAMVGS